MLRPVRPISRSIAKDPRAVAAFAGDRKNLPRWAAGLSSGIREEGGVWRADSPMGQVTVRFAPAKEWGVLDHDVTLPDGTTVHNPLRVLPNGDGSEIVFSVFQPEGMSDADFARDAGMIEHDLETLKKLLEA